MAAQRWGYLIAFKVKAHLTPAQRVKFCRELYGYVERSQYSKYHYRRVGLLERLGYVVVARGVFIIGCGELQAVKKFLRGQATFTIRRVALTPRDAARLRLKLRSRQVEEKLSGR